MKKFTTPLIIIGILLLGYFYIKGKYNNFINLDEDTKKGWSEVQTQYQRRADVFLSQLERFQFSMHHPKNIFQVLILDIC